MNSLCAATVSHLWFANSSSATPFPVGYGTCIHDAILPSSRSRTAMWRRSGVTGAGGKGGSSGGTCGASSKGGAGGSGIDGGMGEMLCSYECRTDAAGVTGWYSGSMLICAADCLGSRAVCLCGGSRSEGCFARGGGAGCTSPDGLISYTSCAPDPNEGASLTWQAAEAATGTGPAIVVSTSFDSSGMLYKWSSTPAFPPESQPASLSLASTSVPSYKLTDLWKRLAALNTTAMPHEPLATNGCTAIFYFRLCRTCTGTTLTYGAPASLTPEMEPIWSWLDDVIGSASSRYHPRNYCIPVGADP